MHHTRFKLLLIAIIGALFYPYSALGERSDVTVSTDVTPIHDSPLNASTDSSSLEENILTNLVQISRQNDTTGNGELDLNVTSKDHDDELMVKTIQKKEIDDQMLNDFKRFLLFPFPFLPFLFPPEEDKNPLTSVNSLKPNGNDLKPEDGKPFILFDFAFNIREIPLSNDSRVSSNDSKVINVKRIDDTKPPPTKEDEIKDFQKMRRRRNISKHRENVGFLDDFPLLPGPQIDELFSKPDFFFPGLSEPKTTKKLSRRKRDLRRSRPDVRSDLQFFMDAIDRAFMDTKNEFEQTDPILSFLKGVQRSPFDGNKKIDLANGFPDQDRPNVNWKIQRNVKRLSGEEDKGLSTSSRDVPMIIVDKVVKIGEFHVDDDKNKLTKDKRTGNEVKRKYIDGLNHDEIRIPLLYETDKEDTDTSNKLSNLGPEVESIDSKIRKRVSDPDSNSNNYDVKSREIKILPQINTSFANVGTNTTIELKKKDESTSGSDKFLKLIDSMRRRIKIDLTNSGTPSGDRSKRRSPHDRQTSKVPFHDDLKKNITQVLNRFFELVKKLDDANLLDKAGEREMEESFDWTETETLQNANVFGKTKKPKKEGQLQEYLDAEKKERQVTDLNYLFLTVTLPTILVFALVLLVCFFNLQVKGKIWTRLFRPRQVFLVEGKPPAQLNGSAVRMKSPQSI